MDRDHYTARLRERTHRLNEAVNELRRAIHDELDWRERSYSYADEDGHDNDTDVP